MHELVRLTVADGRLVIDRDRRLGGRGVHLCPDAACAGRVRKRGAIARRLRAAVAVPPDLEELIGLEVEATAAKWKN